MHTRYKQDYEHISVEYGMQDNQNFLIIDDNLAILTTLYDILVRQGCRVTIARDYHKGLLLANKFRFDVVLADIVVNKEKSLDAFCNIKLFNPDTKVLLMTGYDRKHPSVKQAIDKGFDILFKPFKLDVLMKATDYAHT